MKKHLLITAILWLFSWASFAQTVATEPSGNGTEGTPYQIETLANLLWITENPEHWDKHYLQTADIDAAETASWNDGEGWMPIGIDANNDFTGTYNGGDYTISNLTINRPTANYQGLFGSAENATIKNIRLVNVNIAGAITTGAIVGQTQYSTIEKCLSTGTVTGTSYVGGLIGFNNYSNITQCFSSVNVTGTNYIGGITGVHQVDNLLLNSYSTGTLTGGDNVGGLVGTTAVSSQIKKSFFAGEIVGDNGIGGLVAYRFSASDAFNCFWDTEASGVSTTEVGGEGKSTAEMKEIFTFTSAGWDFKGLGDEGIWNIDPDGYPYLSWINPTNDGPEAPVVANIISNEITNITGNGATINATITCVGYPAATQHGICWNTTGSPTIANDKTTEGVVAQAGSFSSTASGLTPNITYYVRAYATNGEGTSYSNEFTFVTVVEPTGNGTPETPYQISNLAELYWIAITPSVWDKHFIQTADIDASQTLSWNNGEGWIPIGNEEELFAGDYNGNKHLITNLHIDRPNSNYIGLFGGVYAAKISDLGLLDVNIVGGSFSAGFSGWLQNSQLERCFVTGSVEGRAGHTGSLIGFATEGSIIKNSYSNANLTGYTGTSAYGGLAGGIYGSNVSNCFMSGIVSLPMGGGLIGYATESEVTGSFWDTETSGFTSSAGGTGKTTAEMNDITTFLDAGWDFKGLGAEGIWNIGNDRNNNYPYLSWQYPDDPAISIEILPSAVITDVTSITQTSATINIDVTNIGNPQGTQFGVCWSSTNPEPTTSDDNELSTEPFALDSYTIGVVALDHSTTYYARAFATNTNGTAYGEVVTFNTECGAHTLPLTENFDIIEFGEIPLCWNRIVEGNGHSQVVEWGYGYSQPKNASLFAQTIGATIYLVSPEIDAEISSVAIEFMARNLWGTDMILELGTMSNPFDANTFEYYSSVTVPVDYQQFSVSYENYLGDNRYIAFRVSSNIQEQRGYVFIDDIAVHLSAGYNVTFNVDMSPAAGFDPNTDVVYLTGSMFGWAEPGSDPDNQTMTRVDDSMIWTKTLQLPANSYEYKYYINAGWDGGELADGSNRYYTVAGESTKDDTWGGVGNCYDAINLKTLTTPYSGTTTTATNNFSLCGMDSSKDLVFYYDVADGELITIWQSWNNYDSRHTLRWGGDCPGINEIACIDDPDTKPVSWYNNTGATQRVWFILAGFSVRHGDFTLSWETETILCNGATIPLTENFDGYSIVPPCWSTTGTNNYEVDVTDYNMFSAPNSARLYHESSSYVILATPEIAGGIQNLRLRFKALLDLNPSIGNLYVGSMTDPTDASTFTSIQMFEVTNQPGDDWHSFEVWFDEYTGSDTHIAFRLGDGTGSETVRAFIDNIEIDVIPSCPEPHNLTIGVVTQTTAEISWDAPGVSLFEIAYGPKGFNPQTEGDIISDISSTTHTLTDLDHSTAYEVYIRSNCGAETSGWSYPATFTTECGAHTLPLTENFDNISEFPNCWNAFTVGDGSVLIYNFDPSSNPNHAWLFAQNIGNEAYLVLPELDADINALNLQFMGKSGGTSYGWPADMVLEIGTMTDPSDASTFTYFTHIQTQDLYEQQNISLTTYSGTDKYIAFRVSSNIQEQRGYVFIDDVTIDVAPSCPAPYSLRTNAVTQTTAEASWTEPATSTQWDIIYGPAGFDPQAEGTLIEGITTIPYTIEGLNLSTTYQFYVRSHCGAELSEWSSVGYFTTECGAHTLPIIENFDNSSQMPQCWKTLATNSGDTQFYEGLAYSEPNMVYLYMPNTSSTAYLISPEIDADISSLQVSFMAMKYTNDMILEVGTMSDPTDPSTFSYFAHIQTQGSYAQEYVAFNSYSGTDRYIAFRVSSNIQEQTGYVFIDDISINTLALHEVTFNVDMTNASNFDPSSDIVYFTGNMFNWEEPGNVPDNQTMSRVDESMIWTKTLQLPEGNYDYNYFLNAGWDNREPINEYRVISVNDIVTSNDNWGQYGLQFVSPNSSSVFDVCEGSFGISISAEGVGEVNGDIYLIDTWDSWNWVTSYYSNGNGTTNYTYNIPQNLQPGEYRFFITTNNGEAYSDYFTITSNSTINFTQPIASQSYEVEIDTEIPVELTLDGCVGRWVYLNFDNNGQLEYIGQVYLDNENKTYLTTYNIPNTIISGTYRFVYHSDAIETYSEYFTINNPNVTLTFNSPNASDTYEVGVDNHIPVEVEYTGLGYQYYTLQISSQNDGWKHVTSFSDENDGVFNHNHTLTANYTSGNYQYKLNYGNEMDLWGEILSDEFVIVNDQEFLELTRPQFEFEDPSFYTPDGSIEIRWNSNALTNVDIHYSLDNGFSWTIIEGNLNTEDGNTYNGNNNYYWDIPGDISGTYDQCKIRVRNSADHGLNSESGLFTISSEDPVTFSSPIAGTTIETGGPLTITMDVLSESWVSLYLQGQYNGYGIDGISATVGTNTITTDDTYMLSTGTYRVMAYHNNSGTQAYSDEFTVTCPTVTLPLTENFDRTSNIPGCWFKSGINYSLEVSSCDGKSYSQPYSAKLTQWGSGYAILASPAIPYELNNLRVRFRALLGNCPSNGTIYVGTISNPTDGSSFTPIQSFEVTNKSGEEWHNFEIWLDEYTGTDTHIAFRLGDGTDENMVRAFIDNIIIDEIPACVEPYNLAVGTVTQTSAEVSWTEPGASTQWDIIYGHAGFDPQTEGTIVAVVTSNTYTLTDLSHSTSYEFYVRTYCGGNPSGWSLPGEFTTECGPVELSFLSPDENQTYDLSVSNQVPYTLDYKGCDYTCGYIYLLDVPETNNWYVNNHGFSNGSQTTNASFELPATLPSGTYRFRVDYSYNDVNYNSYSNEFEVVNNAAVIEVISPYANNYINSGETYYIYWNSVNVSLANLYYSTNNGSTWQEVAEDIVTVNGQNLFVWEVPADLVGTYRECMVKVTNADQSAEGLSPLFTISSLPEIKFNLPLAGAIYIAGVDNAINVEIEYNGTGYSEFELYFNGSFLGYLSIDDQGVVYYAYNLPADLLSGTYSFRIGYPYYIDSEVFSVANNDYKFEFTAPLATSQIDLCDGTIDIKVLIEGFGEISGDIYLQANEGGRLWVSSYSSTSDGETTYTYNIPVNDLSAGNYYFVLETPNETIHSEIFAITDNTTVIFTQPLAAQTYQVGVDTEIPVELTLDGCISRCVDLYFDNNGQLEHIGEVCLDNETNTHLTAYSIPNTIISGTYRFVYYFDAIETYSEYFTINNPNVTLTFNSPNASDTYEVGVDNHIPVEVEYTGLGYLYFNLYIVDQNQTLHYVANYYAENDGVITHNHALTENYPTGEYTYRLDYSNYNDIYGSVFSNQFQIINNQAALSLINPQSNGYFMPGNSIYISWNSNAISNVDIHYSLDNGFTWNLIEANVETQNGFQDWGYNSYQWQIPTSIEGIYEQSKIRVRNSADHGLNSESGLFVISSIDPITFIAPIAGTAIETGDQLTISMDVLSESWVSLYLQGQYNGYGIDGISATVGTNTITTDDTYMLKPGTYRVRSYHNNSGTEAYSDEFTVTCPTVTLPLVENFDRTSNLPGCWFTSGSNYSLEVSTCDGKSYSQPYSAKVTQWENGYAILASPAIPANLNSLRVRFRALLGNCPSNGTIYVGTMSNPTDGSTFTPIQSFEVTNKPGSPWHSFEAWLDEYTGSDAHIAFRLGDGTSENWSRVFIDNIIIDEIPSCVEPYNLAVGTVTQTSAEISWTEPETSTQWDIIYGAKGFNPLTHGELVVGVTQNPYTLEGLNHSSEYEFYVRTYCGGTPSGWSVAGTLTTECGPVEISFLSPDENQTFDLSVCSQIPYSFDYFGCEQFCPDIYLYDVTETNGWQVMWPCYSNSVSISDSYSAPATLPSGTYKFRMEYWYNEQTNYVYSNEFEVVNNNSLIDIWKPNSSSYWVQGYNYTICWNSVNVVSINISYSLDNGVTWSLIESSVLSQDGSNSYSFNVPTEITGENTQCLIKMEDASNSSVVDYSDPFTISNIPPYSYIEPNALSHVETLGNMEIIIDNRFYSWMSFQITDVNYNYVWVEEGYYNEGQNTIIFNTENLIVGESYRVYSYHNYKEYGVYSEYFTVSKATPTITEWPTATEITFGDALSASSLAGGYAEHNSTQVEGTFTFDSPTYEPGAGPYLANVTFTPTNSETYSTVSGTVEVGVAKADPEISVWPVASAITYGEAISQSTISGGTVDVAGTFSFDSPATKPNAGTYAADVTFTPTDNANYNTVMGSVDITVNTAPLTIIANSFSKQAGTDYVFAGDEFTTDPLELIGSDEVTSVTISSDGSASTAAEGDYPTVPSSAMGSGLGNYSITYQNGTLSVVNKTILTIEGLTIVEKEYDGTRNAAVLSWGNLSGFEETFEDVQLDITNAVIHFDNKNAGNNKTVIVSGLALTGEFEWMYSINDQIVSGNILQKPLTITAPNCNKTYGETDPEVTVSYNGFIAGENESILEGTLAITREPGEDVDTYTITPAGLSSNNYNITFQTGLLTINAKELIITANDAEKIYGSNDPALNVSYTGFEFTDNETVLLGELAVSRETGEDVNTYLITPSGLSASNYSLSYVNGTFTITPKTLTIKAENKNKVYGSEDPAFSIEYSGFAAGDDLSTLSGALEFSRDAGENVGTYAIVPSGYSSTNYTIGYTPGALSITPKLLTISANNASKVYGTSDPAFTVSYTGFIAGEDKTVLNGTLGTNRESGETVANYVITPSGLSSTNYTISYATGLLSITAKELTVGGSFTTSNREYDGTNAATISANSLTLQGVITSDEVTLNPAVAFDNKNTGTSKVVSLVSATTLAGIDAGNYALTLTGAPTATANITAKELTVTGAIAASKVYDGTTNAIISGATLSGVIGSDVVNLGNATTGTFAQKFVGADVAVTTAITISGTDAGNYTVSQPSDLQANITTKELTIEGSFTVHDKEYDGNTTATINENNLTLAGSISGDEISLTDITIAFANADIGDDKTVSITTATLGGAEKNNYTLSLEDSPTTTASITVSTTTYTVTYSVVGGNGSLAATVDDSPINSGDEILATKAVEFTATPLEGYRVKRWTNNGTTVAGNTTNNYTVSGIQQNTSVTVEFEEIPPVVYTLTLVVSPANAGTVTGEGEYEAAEQVTITASPAEGFVFTGWTGNVAEPLDATTTFTMPAEDATVTANFEPEQPETFTVTFSVVGTPANGTLTAKVDGIAITSGDYIVNSKAVEFTATPLEGYRVKRWTNNGTTVAGNTTNNYTVSGIQQNTSVTVEFEEIPPVVYTLTLVVSPANAGTVTGEGEYEAAEQVTITASPAEGFVFTGWTGNVAEPLDATTTFTMPAEDATVTANFEPEQPETFTVTFSVVGTPANGTLTAKVDGIAITSGDYIVNSKAVEFTATPLEGYRVKRWTNNGTTVAGNTTNSYTVSGIQQNTSVTVEFEEIPPVVYTLTLVVSPANAGTVTGEGEYEAAEQVTITASPAEGFVFTGWTGNVAEPLDATTTFTMPAEDATVTANFEPEQPETFTVTFSVVGTPANGTLTAKVDGIAITSGDYIVNSKAVEFTATPLEGYRVKRWTNNGTTVAGNTTNNYTVSGIQQNTSVTVEFEEIPPVVYTLTLVVSPANAGTVTGEGEYEAAEQVTITASPAEGFVFTGWTGNVAEPLDATTTFTMPAEDATVTANFEPEQPETFTVTFSVVGTPANGTLTAKVDGIAITSGDYIVNSKAVEFTATPLEGYRVKRWTNNGTTVAGNTTNNYTVSGIQQNTSVTVEFEEIPPVVYTLTLVVSPANAGTVTGEGEYEAAEQVTITASPAEGFVFTGWTGNVAEPLDATTTFTMPAEDATVTANFEPEQPETFTVTFSVVGTPANGTLTAKVDGIAITSGDYIVNSKAVEFTATPLEGYRVKRWTNNGTTVAGNTTNNYTVSGIQQNTSVTVEFEEIPPVVYTLTLVVSPANAGTVTGEGEYEAAEQVTITASPAEGFVFTGWTGNVAEPLDATTTFTMPAEDATVTANFEPEQPETFTVTFSVVGTPANGTLTAKVDGIAITSGDYIVNSKAVEFTATPLEGYRVKRWTNNGTTVAGNTTNSYTVSGIQQNTSVTVEFEEIPPVVYTLTLVVSPANAGTVTGEGEYEAAEQVTITASPAEGFVFTGWTGNVAEPLDATTTFTMPAEDATVTANFEPEQPETFTVTFSVVGTPANGTLTAKVDGIAITSGDYIVNSKAVEFTATPLEGYRVKRWTNNGTTVAGNTTNNYTVSGIQQNTSVTVEFEEIPPVVYTLTLVVSPANAGTVTGEGEYEAAEQVTITASPAEGFVFTGWTGNVAEPLDATTTFTMPAEDATVTANFEPEQPETFTVTFSVVGTPANGTLTAKVDGIAITSGDYIVNSKAVEFTATPLEGYRVKRWTNNGTTVAGNTTNSYTVSGIQQNTSVTVEFEEIPPVVYTLTLVVSPANAGTVTGEGEYEAAEQVTITASPAEGFVFTGWTGNVAEPLDATTTFTMPAEDATVTANFEPEQPETFTVTFTVKSNTQEPIEDAEISVDSEVITTNSNGEASTSLANGSYTYSVTATGYEEHSGNFSVSGANKSIAITLVAVGYNVELLSDVEIYPNPFDQKIVIKGIEGVQRIAITNVAGQLIKNIKISNETEITIGAGNISAGTYIVTLYFTNGDIQNRKIVKVN